MVDTDAHGQPLMIERGAFKGGSPLVIIILAIVSIFCLYVLGHLVRNTPIDHLALILFAAFPALAIPLIAWEVRRCLPARFEMDAGSARLFLNGKLKEEIVFGPTVKADVTLDSNRIGPAPRAFDDTCAEGPLGPPREDFLLLCGISLAQGERSITISHDNGWRLIDFNVIWDQFFHLVVEHEMEMGSEIWRYVEFRDSFSELGDDVEPDIFGRIRALET